MQPNNIQQQQYMELTISIPALLFPAISLIMLAYTNRFLTLAGRVRKLHDEYLETPEHNNIVHGQIKNLRYRLNLIKNMQILGVLAFLGCILCMYFIYINYQIAAHFIFALSLILFSMSLFISLIEVWQSTKAIELELSDMEDLDNPSVVQYIKKTLDLDSQ